ncbi:hypothetical protein C5167_005217 [Papaver somniferum]|uniref:LysM domain-containing protein n=1 Tax=Papaver somniferum TaxID=3469 RepID=A0A4Y7J9Z0_PAPSO|nr:uncharacterized protein LOC113275267 [Papaver somniferum]RZC57913.1 hypothetical protein C5167_005217 [Papaver somniferum]
MSSIFSSVNSSSSSSSSAGGGGGGGALNYIEHHVSKFDTLAGVAIKYGVEVADVKRMNGLVTDLQMFALKTLQIPLPGRHPPSASLSNGQHSPGESMAEQIKPSRARSDVLESLQSLGFRKTEQRVSSAMSSLQGYYGLKSPKQKMLEEGTEMANYRTGNVQRYFQDEVLSKPLLTFETSPSQQRSLVNGSLVENGDPLNALAAASSKNGGEADKSNEKSVRRRQKSEVDLSLLTPEKVLKEENNGSNGISTVTGRGLALRPKSVSRNLMSIDTDMSWLNPFPVGLGDSLIADGFVVVKKSSSTSNLQDQESNGSSSSIWPTSGWSDLQALSSAASITRPIFDGLPKPMSGRKNKAALD